jgi:arylsulfatase A-like enzyme
MTKTNSTTTRRRFVQTSASSLALASVGLGRASQAQPSRPNVIFIMADDLGYADVSCYGQRDFTTPNVDRLAIEGLKFLQGYSNSAVCSPTRVALTTGRYQYRLIAGLEEVINLKSPKGAGLPPSHPTLPSIFKQAGYGTTLVGKWHLGFLPNFSPLKSGYDHFFGILGGSADYFNHGSKSEAPLYEQEVPVDRIGYMTNLLGDRAVQTVEGYARAKQPFFMSLHFTAPHWPWEGPHDEAESKRIGNRIRHYDGGTRKTYREMVQSLDANIGRVLQALDIAGLTNNTIVVFTSDNGGERFSDVWPFTGMKGELLEGGIRVPAIVRWPGRVAPSTTSEQAMISMDWMPTLLAAAGLAPASDYPPDGENLLPILSGQAPHARKLYWRFRAGAQRAVREGDWKYLRIASNEFLFDLGKDPRERGNLRNRHKDVFERLKADWETWSTTMLPEHQRPVTYTNSGNVLGNRYGVSNPPRPEHGGSAGKAGPVVGE